MTTTADTWLPGRLDTEQVRRTQHPTSMVCIDPKKSTSVTRSDCTFDYFFVSDAALTHIVIFTVKACAHKRLSVVFVSPALLDAIVYCALNLYC